MKRVLVLSALLAGCQAFERSGGHEFADNRLTAGMNDHSEHIVRSNEIHVREEGNKDKWLGYLKGYRQVLEGEKEPRNFYKIYDVGMNMIGYVNDRGTFYRIKGTDLQPMGEYDLMDGLKLFFGYRLRTNLTLETVNPYRD